MWTRRILISSLILLSSCSAVAKIQKNSNDIRSIAQESKENFEKINEAATVQPPRIPEIQERSHQGISQQAQIIEKTETVIETTAKVEDKIPWWVDTIEIVLISLSILGVILFLWYSGVGLFIQKLVGYVPSAKRNEAKLLAEALDSKEDTTFREAVAYLRAKDPLLDAAFRKRRDA